MGVKYVLGSIFTRRLRRARTLDQRWENTPFCQILAKSLGQDWEDFVWF